MPCACQVHFGRIGRMLNCGALVASLRNMCSLQQISAADCILNDRTGYCCHTISHCAPAHAVCSGRPRNATGRLDEEFIDETKAKIHLAVSAPVDLIHVRDGREWYYSVAGPVMDRDTQAASWLSF